MGYTKRGEVGEGGTRKKGDERRERAEKRKARVLIGESEIYWTSDSYLL